MLFVLVFPHWVLGSTILGYGVWGCQFALMEFADSIYVHNNRMILAGRGQVWSKCVMKWTVCFFPQSADLTCKPISQYHEQNL